LSKDSSDGPPGWDQGLKKSMAALSVKDVEDFFDRFEKQQLGSRQAAFYLNY
jgi:hypothetical protein